MFLDFPWGHLWNKALYVLDKGIKYFEILRYKVPCQSTSLLLFELFPKGCMLSVLCRSVAKTAKTVGCVAACVDSLDRINQRRVGRMKHLVR